MSSKTINNSRRTSRQEEKSNYKRKEEEAEKAVNQIELNEKMIEEVVQRIGRIPTGSPMDKAEEAMRGISRSPFAQWIVREVKPNFFNPPMLETFQGKSDPISNLLQFKQKTSLEEISEGLTCKLFAKPLPNKL